MTRATKRSRSHHLTISLSHYLTISLSHLAHALRFTRNLSSSRHPISACLFRPVQCAVSEIDQLFGRADLFAHGRDADAGRDRAFLPRGGFYRATELLGDDQRAGVIGVGQDDGKLLTAIARRKIRRAQ